MTLEVSRLLGPEPVDTAFAAAEPYRPLPSNEDQHPENQPLLVGQRPMLAAHLLGQDRFYHLMFTLHSREALDPRRVRDAITTLTRRHESLRTVFSVDDGSFRRRVLNHWEPDLVVQRLALAADVIATVHGGLAAESVRILRPLRRPAAHFVLTQTPDGDLLTFLVHHLLADGWALGILLKEFAALYARPAADLAAAVSPEAVAADADRAEQTGVLEVSRERLKERLKGVPLSLALPTDVVRPAAFDGVGARLVSQLRDEARAAVDIVARREGVTGTSVLMSAWGLVVARRCGVEDLLIGVPVAHRGSHALAEAVALRTRVVPVRCRVPSKVTVGAYVRSIAGELAAAVADAALPFETLPDTLGRQPDPRQNPLTQIGFAAHDDLVPAQLDLGGGHPARVVEGHCGGAVFDALLYVQSRNDQLRVALDYAPSAQSAEEAASLVESLDGALRELAADGSARLGDLSAMSPRQGQDVLAHGAPSDVPAVDSIWSAFEIAARSSPRQVAIRPGAQAPRLTYAQLYDAACAQSQALHLAGVRAGDRVALALPRSAAETVAVLAVLRLGAAYVALDPASPSAWLAHVLESSRPRAVVADGDRAALVRPLLSPDCPLLPSRPHPDPAPPFTGDGSTGDGSIGDDMVPAYATGPDDIAYVCFTSGTTGRPKGVAVPHRGVLRLLADPTMLAPAGPPETGSRTAGARRFLRLAPLSFDASTLELFAPLLTGGCLHIFTPEPVAVSALADFIRDEKLTGAWLTAGLFRLVADHRPDAFAGLDVLLTGGDVVPVDRVT
ncbi:MAG: AMP-binding protein, partial [Frankia sp.]